MGVQQELDFWGAEARAQARAEAIAQREKEDALMPKYTYTPRRKVERIVIQGSVFMRCPICGRNVHLRYVGLRVMPDGTVRNQPRCGKCRKEKA